MQARLTFVFVAALAAVLLSAGQAGAVTLVNPDGTVAQPYQRWAGASLMPTVRERIVVQPTTPDCGVAPACSNLTDGVLEFSPGLAPDALDYELGHFFGVLLTPAERLEFADLIGTPTAPWYALSGPLDGADSVEGAWAADYGSCAAGVAQAAMNGPPLCAFVLSAGRAHADAVDWPAVRHRRKRSTVDARRHLFARD